MTDLSGAIKAFLDKSSKRGFDRPWLALAGEMLYATNGHILIEIPVKRLPEGFSVEPWGGREGKAPKLNKVFWNPKRYYPLDAEALLRTVTQEVAPEKMFYETPEFDECETCEGDGWVESSGQKGWAKVDCPDCDGAGKIRNDNPGEKIPLVVPVPFMGRSYNLHYLKAIWDFLDLYCGTWEVAQGPDTGRRFSTWPTLFRNYIRGIRIAIMECRP